MGFCAVCSLVAMEAASKNKNRIKARKLIAKKNKKRDVIIGADSNTVG